MKNEIKMNNTPVHYETVKRLIDSYQLADFGKATIREVVAISNQLEEETGTEFIHMEMGVPGLKPAQVGTDAEIDALKKGIAAIYPNINGLQALKDEASRFIKAFIDIDLSPEGCVPVTGSMQGTFASFLTCGQCNPQKNTILFIDPLSTLAFRFRNNKSPLWVIITCHSTYMNIAEKSSVRHWKNTCHKKISLPSSIPIRIIPHGSA